MIDTFEAKSFLSPAECGALRAELGQAAGSQATVLGPDPGGEVKPLARRSTRMSVPVMNCVAPRRRQISSLKSAAGTRPAAQCRN
jgi:hypothetical protein